MSSENTEKQTEAYQMRKKYITFQYWKMVVIIATNVFLIMETQKYNDTLYQKLYWMPPQGFLMD